MKEKPSSFLAGIVKNPASGGLAITAMISLALFLGITIYVNNQSNLDGQYISHADELRVLSGQIAKSASEAAAGKREAYAQLKASKDEFSQRWNLLVVGDPQKRLPSSELASQSGLQEVWKRVAPNADVILNNQQTVLDFHQVAGVLSQSIPRMQAEYEGVVDILLENNASAPQVALAQRQPWLAERMARSISKIIRGDTDATHAEDVFGADARVFGVVLNGMLQGNRDARIAKIRDPEAVFSLNEIGEIFTRVNNSVEDILNKSDALFSVRNGADAIFQDSQNLLLEASQLADRFEAKASDRQNYQYLAYLFGAIAIVCLGIAGFLSYRATQADLKESAQKNDQNQKAILRLLDELADLADGDLTTTATVTEDFTGAIADSINFAIDQMRILVSSINETAVEVSAAAQETQATAMHLAEASEHQAQEIAGASAAINEMAVSIDQVSANAAESAAVAERSVAIANKGAEVVQNTIRGMDNIREQIQETSKRIKRLGESSQEIGDIVSLINDIADQTNILALNAAIQASMAGEAGRGFAVVADEVQRLAERSSAATKQIEALVKQIQSDTNEAVISMEQTTSQVVEGAQLAQDAGVSLEEIETVSKNLASLIQNISNAARQQASSAGHISNTMNVIQEITSQTSSGTTATANSIGNLADMANRMRSSVAGFKLPEVDTIN